MGRRREWLERCFQQFCSSLHQAGAGWAEGRRSPHLAGGRVEEGGWSPAGRACAGRRGGTENGRGTFSGGCLLGRDEVRGSPPGFTAPASASRQKRYCSCVCTMPSRCCLRPQTSVSGSSLLPARCVASPEWTATNTPLRPSPALQCTRTGPAPPSTSPTRHRKGSGEGGVPKSGQPVKW